MKSLRYIAFIGILIAFAGDTRSQSLDELLRAADTVNLSVRKFEYLQKAYLEQGQGQLVLKDPVLGLGVGAVPIETRLGPNQLTVGLMQTFPGAGARRANESVWLTSAEKAIEQGKEARLNIQYRIRTAYYSLYLINAQETILKNHLLAYNTLRNVSLGKVESGTATMADVFRIQIQISGLENSIIRLENQRDVYMAEINALLNRPIHDTIITVDAFDSVCIFPGLMSGPRPQEHPSLRKLDLDLRISEQRQSAYRKSNNPVFGVGVDYSFIGVNEASDQGGRDAIIPKVSMSIPVFRQDVKARNREEEWIRESILTERSDLENFLSKETEKHRAEYINATVQLKQLLEQQKAAKAAYEVLIADYSTNDSRFSDVMEIQNVLLEYELAMIRARMQTYYSVAAIKQLLNY